jgi:predicted RNA-binding Zn ribbon-like protein
MVETPTAATMRLDGGHPALDLVNTLYAQVGGPVEHDVLTKPDDLVTFARRTSLAGPVTPSSPAALQAALTLRAALDPLLRASLHTTCIPTPGTGIHLGSMVVRTAFGEADVAVAGRAFEGAARAAQEAAQLVSGYAWAWDDADPLAPVDRLAHAAAGLLTSEAELARLHCCEGCCWLFLDYSRGAGRRWCSMADCGTEAKKRRYVERRRERRRTAG